MKKILITGITGFVGSHLAEAYLEKGYEVHGTYRYHHLGDEFERIEHIKPRLFLHDCDLRDRNSVFKVLNDVKPEVIHHLAAQSFVRASWDNPEFTINNNINCQLNIFEIVRELKKKLFNFNPVIHIAGSSEEYGIIHDNELPVIEDNPLRPLSPYAVSKIAQDMLGQQYHQSYQLRVVITRAFNHEGARRGKDFVTSAFASQIVDIIKKRQDPVIKVGNLEAKRDYTDIADMVRAYMLAVEKCEYGTPYNICSGTTHKIQEILDYYLTKTEKKGIKVKVLPDPDRMRPSDLPILLGDNAKFRRATGWSPEVSFEQMLNKIFIYWREK